jgi:hypothetical protein
VKVRFSEGAEGVIERGVSIGAGRAESGIEDVNFAIRVRNVSIVFVAWMRTILGLVGEREDGGRGGTFPCRLRGLISRG